MKTIAKARLVRVGPRRPPWLTLRTLREAAGKTQAQVANASGLSRAEVRNLEEDTSLNGWAVEMIRRYIHAIGLRLELVSVSKYGHRIALSAASQKMLAVDVEKHLRWLETGEGEPWPRGKPAPREGPKLIGRRGRKRER